MAPPHSETVASQGGIARPAKRTFTWQQLSAHNKEGDAYVGIHGNVYNVTEWMAVHPGGKDVLLVAAGRDVSQVFDSYHKSTTHQQLAKFHVGTLITNELPVFPKPSAFQTTVRQRVADYFTKNRIDPKNTPYMWGRYLAIFGILGAAWYGQLVLAQTNFGLAVVMALVVGLCCAMIGLTPMHDSSHFSITHSPLVWRLLGLSHDFLNGSSVEAVDEAGLTAGARYLVWLYQHMLGHHPYTNVDGADPDIDTSEVDLRRIKTSQKWYDRYVLQHIYIPIVYALLGVKTRFQDIVMLYFVKRDGAIRINPPTLSHQLVFWLGKAFFVYYRFVVPAAHMDLWRVFALFAIADAVSSYWLAILFQANHVVDVVSWPTPDKTGLVNIDWAEMQVMTSQDYGHGSWFWTVFSGSLNHQVVHHLFPGVNQFYYPKIAPIIMQTCKEFAITYHVKPNVVEAVSSHIQHLYNLGQNPATEAARGQASRRSSTKSKKH